MKNDQKTNLKRAPQNTLRNKFLTFALSGGLALAAVTMLSACATISQDECVAGNWSDLGYRDGNKGVARDRIADYVSKCGEYGQDVDRQSYLSSYETGLSHYCVYDKGYALGEKGNHYNAVCSGELASDFRAGFDDGFAAYELRQRYDGYNNKINNLEDEVDDVADRLRDPALTDAEEKKRLKKKRNRLREELSDLEWDFNRFKREFGLD